MTDLLMSVWDGVDTAKSKDGKKNDAIAGHPLRVAYYKLSVIFRVIADSGWFQNGVIVVILLAGTLVGLQTDKAFENNNKTVLTILDQGILIIFIIEIVVKIIAEDAYPLRFFKSAWNCFDLLIVVGSIALAGAAGGAMQMLRLLRLLRVLKLVKAFPQLQVIVNALIMGLSSIGFIGIILVLVFYMLAILGMMLFAQNDPWHFGDLQVSHRHAGRRCPKPSTPPPSLPSLTLASLVQTAMLTLFRCATLEDWTDVMYINMYGCHKYGYSGWMEPLCVDPYPLEGENWLSAFYFIFFTLIGSLVLLTLFIGVVSTSMDEASEQQREEMEVEDKIKNISNIELLSKEDVETFRKVFGMLDLDGGGTIEEEELRVGLQSIGKHPTDTEMLRMMHDVDEDDSGEIDPAEFIQFMVNMRKKDTKEKSLKMERSEADTANNSNEDTPAVTPPTSNSPNALGLGFGFMTPPPSGFQAHAQLQVSALTPMRTIATVGADQNFGLPILQSPTNENWLDMSLDMGRSRKKLPKIGSARIAPS